MSRHFHLFYKLLSDDDVDDKIIEDEYGKNHTNSKKNDNNDIKITKLRLILMLMMLMIVIMIITKNIALILIILIIIITITFNPRSATLHARSLHTNIPKINRENHLAVSKGSSL